MRWLLIILTVGLGACSNRTSAPIVPGALVVGSNKTVFVGTTRVEDENGNFGIGRSSKLSLLELDISIPPNRDVGTISDGQDHPNPQKDFAIAARRDFKTKKSFQTRIGKAVASKPASERDVVVFVHGYNNSFSEAAFRIAQLSEDLDINGVTAAYAWSSRGHPLGYEYDSDSALFARDGLQELLETVHDSGANRVFVVAHSLGSRLLMESLRQIEIAKPGWTSRNLSGVVLFSPDVNAEVFLSQTNAFQTLPQPFVIFSSQSDKVLKISARLRGEKERLGSLKDLAKFNHLPISFIDVTAFEDGSAGNHFVGGTSPTLLSLLKAATRLGGNALAGNSNTLIGLPGQRRVLRNITQITITPESNR